MDFMKDAPSGRPSFGGYIRNGCETQKISGKAGLYKSLRIGICFIGSAEGRMAQSDRHHRRKMMKMLRNVRMALLALAFLAFAVPRAGLAYEGDGPRFGFNTQTYSKADVDSGGKYSRTDMNFRAGYKWLTFAYTRSDYDWSSTGDARISKGRNPWDTLHKLSLDAAFDGYLSESVDWFAGATLVSGFGSQVWNSFSLMPRAGLTFRATPEFKFHLGAVGIVAPAHSMLLPRVGLEWRDSYDMGLSAKLGFPATQIQYRFNEMVAARLSAKWTRDLYRLASDSSVARKGYMEEESVTSGAYLDLTPIDRLKLTVGAEMMAWRSMRVYDKDGDKMSKTDMDPSVGAVLRASYSF